MPDWLKAIPGGAALAVSFFTRLPVPLPPLGARSLSSAFWAAPIAGWAVGLIGAAAFWLAHLSHLSAGIAAALALAATMVATGCLHEDGLSDTADGFGGGRDRARKLEIMRDSRIGSYGAAALALSILLRWNALAELATPLAVLAAMIAAHGASRAMLPLFMYALRPARTEGLSAGAGSIEELPALIAVLLGALSLAALGPHGALAAAGVLLVAFLAFGWLCLRQISGQTGDTVGAMQQISEIAVLVAATVFLS
ncbi:MAG: adenosylcobinamide-GDP ribazoletransferase [Rhizobiaceae bacterium]|nr:adenosylcobinamide-GDP ribazoletransferase [Rhizobiaceae bacterium]